MPPDKAEAEKDALKKAVRDALEACAEDLEDMARKAADPEPWLAAAAIVRLRAL